MLRWIALGIIFWSTGFSLEKIEVAREDGSLIQGYVDLPQQKGKFPLVIFIDGSYEETVLKNHERLAPRFLEHKIGVLSIEKRGITTQGINTGEFIVHDCFEERLRDHQLLLKALEQGKIPGWNRKCVLLGGSEGGKIAPALALKFSKSVTGLVLVGAGGGFSFSEEMKYNSEQHIRQMNSFKKFGFKVRRILYPHEYEESYAKILQHPDSLEIFGEKTFKWWASYLRYHPLQDLLKVDVPIYIVHGEEDTVLPVKSSDRIHEAFHSQGKTNLHYVRPQNLGHSLQGRDDVYEPMIAWIEGRL